MMARFHLLQSFVPTLLLVPALWFVAVQSVVAEEDHLEPIRYNNPGLVVDLGVGLWAWPLPMDYDRDGDIDLIVCCPDKPYNGTYFFENPGSPTGNANAARGGGSGEKQAAMLPVFQAAVKVAKGPSNVQVSYVDGEPVVLEPGKMYIDFREHQFDNPIKLPIPTKVDSFSRIRANQWKLVDWEGDGDLDVMIGVGVWDDYGWDDAWDDQGHWKNGPLHGYVYLAENLSAKGEKGALFDTLKSFGTTKFAPARKLMTLDGKLIDVYGMPSPNFADFDNDGDLDLICGEFLDGFTWFENQGTRGEPKFAAGQRLAQQTGRKLASGAFQVDVKADIRMDLQMITPVAVDWDGDGDIDLVCGDEDGRVALIDSQGRSVQGMPYFSAPQYLQQQAAEVKFGALVTPVSIDFDGDGDEDLICGNTAGYFGFFENISDTVTPNGKEVKRELPQWKDAVRLGLVVDPGGNPPDAGPLAVPLRLQAGPQGSIQGPCEAKWGYSAPAVGDLDNDGVLDLVTNGIWGRITAYRQFRPQTGRHSLIVEPMTLQMSEGVDCPRPEWNWWSPKSRELVTQWRTTPCVVDWDGDKQNDLIMLDHEGFLAFYQGEIIDKELTLRAPKRIFKIEGPCEFEGRHKVVGNKKDGLLRLNANRAGGSGRRKLCLVDWDGDGRLDLLVNSVNVNWLRNVRTDEEGFVWFQDMGLMDDRILAGHTTSPTTVDWDQNGIPDLLVGAEDGRLYYKRNPRAK
ncbi:MAG: VCBS repeat-containing protein [Planctomycetaceae bacterium]